MFTGIVERTGRVVSIVCSPSVLAGSAGNQSAANRGITQLVIDAGNDFDTKIGDSVSVNGCCLTITSNSVKMLAFDISRETLERTNLADLEEGTLVNLERAMRLGDRLGGHMVSGHIDGIGEVVDLRKQADGWAVHVALTAPLRRYVIEKGSICIDGVSLTVNQLKDLKDASVVELMLIPTTVSLTSLKDLCLGKRVNIEVDMLGKYLERLNLFRGHTT